MRPVSILVPLLVFTVAACSASGTASAPASAGAPQPAAPAATAQPAMAGATAAPAETAEPAAAAGTDPSCEQVLTPAELAAISTVEGWTLTRWDDDMPDTDVTCQWDFKLDTPEWLHAEVHVWSDPQAASFLDGGLPGDAVPGLGDAAAWDPIGGRLLVQLGSRVVGVVPGSWLGPDGPEAGALAMAKLVIPRVPK
jgi:hypothetical protein